jgi:hypothetical protein
MAMAMAMAMATDLLNILHRQVDYSFSRIVIEDESWFFYRYLSDQSSQPAEMKSF